MTVLALVSMIHEPADRNSLTRRFRGEPVLAWTLRRLGRSARLSAVTVQCWADQHAAGATLALANDAGARNLGPRSALPSVDAVTASRRWADGWRGGLAGTCDFDLGFHAPFVRDAMDEAGADAVLLVDPAAALVDASILDALVAQADAHPDEPLYFTQAAPGLGGVLLRSALVDTLAAARLHPGRLLHYIPQTPVRDPIAGHGCAPVPTPIARTTRRFKLDSSRQVARLTAATAPLNGTLAVSGAESLVRRLDAEPEPDALPREVVLELTTRRASRPIFRPGGDGDLAPRELDASVAAALFRGLAAADDVRLTLAGAGDPLAHPRWREIVSAARDAGIEAVHVETDLLCGEPDAEHLARSGADVVSIHLPAVTAATYAAVMGIDGYARVLANIKALLLERQRQSRLVPLVVPVFTKCAANLAEMEAWYDQWLNALGAATIVGPASYGGRVADVGVADMTPPRRVACRRLASRLVILADGRIVSCEQDVTGLQPLGRIGTDAIADVWRAPAGQLRAAHASGEWGTRPLCAGCKEWHRP